MRERSDTYLHTSICVCRAARMTHAHTHADTHLNALKSSQNVSTNRQDDTADAQVSGVLKHFRIHLFRHHIPPGQDNNTHTKLIKIHVVPGQRLGWGGGGELLKKTTCESRLQYKRTHTQSAVIHTFKHRGVQPVTSSSGTKSHLVRFGDCWAQIGLLDESRPCGCFTHPQPLPFSGKHIALRHRFTLSGTGSFTHRRCTLSVMKRKRLRQNINI